MKKIYLFASLLLWGMMFLSTSCKDGDTSFEDDEFSTIFYMDTYGLQEVTFPNLGTASNDVTYSFTIGKGGTNPNTAGEVSLIPFTEEEFEQYNKDNLTQLILLPEKYYTYTDKLTLSPESPKQTVNILLKKEISIDGLDIEGKEYAIGLNMKSQNGSINNEQQNIIIKIKANTPSLSITNTGLLGEIRFYTGLAADDYKTFNLPIKLNQANNNWNFKVKLVTNREKLEALVNEYNLQKLPEIPYKLLPEECYELPELSFSGDINTIDAPIKIIRGTLVDDEPYLLPIMLETCEGMPFTLDKAIGYIPVKVISTLPKQVINVSDIILNNTQDVNSNSNLVDNDYTNKWESLWMTQQDPRGNLTNLFDPQYGVYFDITNIDISNQIKVTLWANAANNYPKKVKIYTGTSSDNLTLLEETEDAFPDFGNEKSWTHEKSLTQRTTIVRIAILSSRNGEDLTQPATVYEQDGGWYWVTKNVGLSEIELWGY